MSRSARRNEQIALAADLRSRRIPMAPIGRALRDRYGINGRLAQRIARGWTQAEAAAAWSARWPDDPKSFKNISYWENWPAPTGHAPSLDVLDKLAQLYECDAADLIAGWGEHAAGVPTGERAEAESLAWQVEHLNPPGLTRSIANWARLLPAARRRVLLLKLSTAASLAAGGAESILRAAVGRGPDLAELAGWWRSCYTFVSTGRNREMEGMHQVELHVSEGRLVGCSEPTPTGTIELDLHADGLLISGTWTDRTAADGYYHGAVYHGLLMLVVDPAGRTMRGRWLGPDREFAVDSGTWTLTRCAAPN